MIDLTKSNSFIASEAAMISDLFVDKATMSDLHNVKLTSEPPTKTVEPVNDFQSNELHNDASLYTFRLMLSDRRSTRL